MKKLLSTIVLAAVFLASCGHYKPATKRSDFNTRAIPAWISVKRIVTATAVQNGEPVNESSTFDTTVNRVYTWTEVDTTRSPVKIKHIYYADDKKAAEVKLTVNSTGYRTWSSHAVWPGDWEVDVTDEDGSVICVATFTVSNTAAAKVETPIQGK